MAPWLDDIITAFNELGGEASYDDLYPIVEKVRSSGKEDLSTQWKASVRRTIQENSPDSESYRESKKVFYSVNGIGSGRWALYPDFLSEKEKGNDGREESHTTVYAQGLEGIEREARYLRRSRDPRLAEARKKQDDFTCQCCKFRKKIGDAYIIDVHHTNPLSETGATITSVEQLVCLCPNCHRIAHTRRDRPLEIDEILNLL